MIHLLCTDFFHLHGQSEDNLLSTFLTSTKRLQSLYQKLTFPLHSHVTTKQKKAQARPVLQKKGYCIKRGSISHVYNVPYYHVNTVTIRLRGSYVFYLIRTCSFNSSIYICALWAAILPSPVAVTICLSNLSRTSPAAKMPRTFVSMSSFVSM